MNHQLADGGIPANSGPIEQLRGQIYDKAVVEVKPGFTITLPRFCTVGHFKPVKAENVAKVALEKRSNLCANTLKQLKNTSHDFDTTITYMTLRLV